MNLPHSSAFFGLLFFFFFKLICHHAYVTVKSSTIPETLRWWDSGVYCCLVCLQVLCSRERVNPVGSTRTSCPTLFRPARVGGVCSTLVAKALRLSPSSMAMDHQ